RTATGRPLLPNITGFLKGMGSWGVIVLPWGVAFGNRLGWSEVAALLDTEVIQRYVEQESHARPFWFYGLVVAVGFLPWVVPLLHAVGRLIRYPRDPATSTTRYALAGLLMGTVLLSFSEGKLPSYFLPLAPLVAMIAAWQVGRQCARNQPGLPELALIIQGGVLATAAVLGGVRQDPGAIRQVLWIVAGAFAAMVIVGGVGYWRRQVWPIYTANAAAAAAILLAIGGFLHPELGARHSARDLVEHYPAIRETTNLRRVAMKLPSLTLYSGRIPVELELVGVSDIVNDAEKPVGLWIFDRRDFESLDPATRRRFRTLGKSGKYVALATHPLPPPP
ncbi:MAG: hypothetical protein OEV00_02610, partial [Acidobacteriota bacterium]|nr:hypothetical protein [Acidobacteriota bacterium]